MSEQFWYFEKLDEDDTFGKVMNMAASPTRRSFTMIQNRKLLPVVKQLANNSMLSNAMHVRKIINNDDRECGISFDGI